MTMADARMPIFTGVIRARNPELAASIDGTRFVLEHLVPVVVDHLERIQGLTTRFNEAFYRLADPVDPGVDPVHDGVEDAVGIGVLWRLADQLRDAHPDVSSGVAPDGRAHERVNRRFGVSDNSAIVDRLTERGD